MQNQFTDLLKTKISAKKDFYKILAIAIGINLLLIAALVILNICVKDITVTVNGKTAQYKTTKNSVQEILDGWNVKLDKEDKVLPGKKLQLKDGDSVEIKLYEVVKETESEAIDFKKKTEYSSELLEGKKKIKTEGVKGEDKVTYEVSYLGGEEQSRKEIDRETVKKPVTEVTLEGTAVSYNGVKYSRKIYVVSTGYTHTGNRTATGTYPKRGTMAVDRSVIPMGSYGYVPGYGSVHAEDTGGAINGNRIDLFFESRGQAISWGRRTVELYIK